MREISFSDETSIPFASPSVPPSAHYRDGSPATQARNKSLVSLMSELHQGDRREGLVWLMLALSAAALLALSLWI
jgi:hypothetical protein